MTLREEIEAILWKTGKPNAPSTYAIELLESLIRQREEALLREILKDVMEMDSPDGDTMYVVHKEVLVELAQSRGINLTDHE